MTGKIVILRGGRPGTEFHLTKARTVVGRAEHADIMLADRAISRQHVEIVHDPMGFTVRDLRSGNGTFLNGQKIREAELVSGDRLKLGTHELNFLQLSGPTRNADERQIVYQIDKPHIHPPKVPDVRLNTGPPQPAFQSPQPVAIPHAPPPAVKKGASPVAVFGILLFSVVALVLAGVIGYQLYMRHKTAEPTPAEIASQYVEDGNRALEMRDLPAARQAFGAALQADPNNADATTGLERTTIEDRWASLLNQAEQQVGQGDFTSAIITLRDVRDSSTLFGGNADTRINHLVGEIVAQGRAAIDAGEVATADRLGRVAIETKPDDPGAQALVQEVAMIRSQMGQAATDTVSAGAQVAAAAPAHQDEQEDQPEQRRSRSRSREAERESPSAAPAARQEESAPEPAPEPEPEPPREVAAAEAVAAPDPEPAPEPEPVVVASRRRSRDDDEGDPSRGWRYYGEGRFDDAAEYFERQASRGSGDEAEEAGRTAERIRSFQDAYAVGRESFDTGDYELAVHDLRRAYSLDRRLNGSYRDELRGLLAEAHYQVARSAYDRERFEESGENARIALGYNASHDETRRLVRHLEARANELFIQAVSYQESNPARARQICRDIREMLPESSDVRQRAEELLESL